MKRTTLSTGRMLAACIMATSFAPLAVANDGHLPLIVVGRGDDSQDGSCTGAANRCNLRAAVAKALSAANGEAIIQLDVPSVVSLGEIGINPNGGAAHLIIQSGQATQITGQNSSKLFSIGPQAKVELEQLEIFNFTVGYSASVVSNAGQLSLRDTVFRNNQITCSGSGVLTAYAACYNGAAISNTGVLTLLDGARFEQNQTAATAYNGASSSATNTAGAILSSGQIILDGEVHFIGNIAKATANAVPRGGAPTSASASASGGAISADGSIKVTDAGQGRCYFSGNSAVAAASAPQGGSVQQSSSGGAIALTSAAVSPGLKDKCRFDGNSAQQGNDINLDTGSLQSGGEIRTGVDYLLVSRYSNKCLDVKDLNTQNGATTQQWECFGGDNQRFRFVDEGDGFYSIVGKASQRCLSAQAVQYEDGTPAIMWDCHSGPDQKLRAAKVGDGLYELRFSHSDKCLDIDGPTANNGAKAQQWQCFSSANQQWILRPAD